jgi:hypothetical protein
MRLHTSAEGMTLARKLENESAKFYEGLAQRYTNHADTFLTFVKENKRNVVDLDRTYNWVITDAIEGCYCFDIDPDEYTFEAGLDQKASLSDVLQMAIEMEEKIIKFYTEAAAQSKPLMADVPRAFSLVARKRSARLAQLRSLAGKE